MTSEDLFAMQKRETEQSRMPEPLQACFESIVLPREKPQVVEMAACGTCDEYPHAARADLRPGQQLGEILTCEKMWSKS